VVQEAASLIYEASLFSAAMVSHSDFSPAAVFKRAATMCESGHSTIATTSQTAVHAEQVVESQEDTVQGLFSAATRIKTMPARPAIERSSITPGVIIVDNSQDIFQFVGPKGKVFVPRQVLLDSGAQSFMLEASTIEGLGLTKDTLEKCPWTISTSMGGTEHATAITKGELALKLNQDDVEDVSFMKVKAIVTEAKSYDVLVGLMVLTLWGSPWISGKRQRVTDQDGKQVTDARRRCQLDLFEFLLAILLTYLLSLVLWMRRRLGLWKRLMKMLLLLTFICKWMLR
jgi:hypothetical protein